MGYEQPEVAVKPVSGAELSPEQIKAEIEVLHHDNERLEAALKNWQKLDASILAEGIQFAYESFSHQPKIQSKCLQIAKDLQSKGLLEFKVADHGAETSFESALKRT